VCIESSEVPTGVAKNLHRQSEIITVCLKVLSLVLSIAYNALQRAPWQMPVDQRFRLVSFNLTGIFGIAPEVTRLKNPPVDTIEIVQIVVELCGFEVGVTVCKYKHDALLVNVPERRNQYGYLFHWSSRYAVESCLDIEEHGRVRSEIERNVIAEHASRRNRYTSLRPSNNKIGVSDLNVIWVCVATIATVQPISEDPRNVGNMRDAKYECFFRSKGAHHLSKQPTASYI